MPKVTVEGVDITVSPGDSVEVEVGGQTVKIRISPATTPGTVASPAQVKPRREPYEAPDTSMALREIQLIRRHDDGAEYINVTQALEQILTGETVTGFTAPDDPYQDGRFTTRHPAAADIVIDYVQANDHWG